MSSVALWAARAYKASLIHSDGGTEGRIGQVPVAPPRPVVKRRPLGIKGGFNDAVRETNSLVERSMRLRRVNRHPDPRQFYSRTVPLLVSLAEEEGQEQGQDGFNCPEGYKNEWSVLSEAEIIREKRRREGVKEMKKSRVREVRTALDRQLEEEKEADREKMMELLREREALEETIRNERRDSLAKAEHKKLQKTQLAKELDKALSESETRDRREAKRREEEGRRMVALSKLEAAKEKRKGIEQRQLHKMKTQESIAVNQKQDELKMAAMKEGMMQDKRLAEMFEEKCKKEDERREEDFRKIYQRRENLMNLGSETQKVIQNQSFLEEVQLLKASQAQEAKEIKEERRKLEEHRRQAIEYKRGLLAQLKHQEATERERMEELKLFNDQRIAAEQLQAREERMKQQEKRKRNLLYKGELQRERRIIRERKIFERKMLMDPKEKELNVSLLRDSLKILQNNPCSFMSSLRAGMVWGESPPTFVPELTLRIIKL